MPDIELKTCPFCGSPMATYRDVLSNKVFVRHDFTDSRQTTCFLQSRSMWITPEEWSTRAAPKVKPLVWVDIRNNAKRAGPYEIRFCQPGVFRIAFHGRIICKTIKGMDRAIEWANNDRERRILEALL